MTIQNIMTAQPICVDMDDTLEVVKALFDEYGFHHLPVVEAGVLRGIISDRDLLRVISSRVGTVAETGQDIVSLNRRAHQIMSREIVSLKHSDTVLDAVDLFINNKISCIPVLEHDRIIGLVSWRDIIKAISPRK